ncbi:MAG: hypothetical protein R1F52_00290 [Candidatus Nitrosoabyssus spongiisocia]|nr:MAG: hypothetical protein R1F52_00290 [Nitrosopumilaceae archaeon AB1(1)]
MLIKGKYATATHIRRFVWAEIVWPLIIQQQDLFFTIPQYQNMRDKKCQELKISIVEVSRGLLSLMNKGIIYKEKNLYYIHYKLIPYLRLNAQCSYATAIYETRVR